MVTKLEQPVLLLIPPSPELTYDAAQTGHHPEKSHSSLVDFGSEEYFGGVGAG